MLGGEPEHAAAVNTIAAAAVKVSHRLIMRTSCAPVSAPIRAG
jgi:hypothetical protein